MVDAGRHTSNGGAGVDPGGGLTRRSFLTKAAAAGAGLSVAGAGSGVFAGTVRAQSGVRVETDTREYKVGPPSNSPEGVVYDLGTRAFYGGASFDGTLYRATLDDRTAELYLPPGVDGRGQPDGRREAAGVNTDDEGRLYVCGGNSGDLYVYDIGTKGLLARFSTGPGGFINDVTITRDGDVYFTDSFRPFIYRVSGEQVERGGGEPEAIPLAPEVEYGPVGSGSAKPFNANGIRPTPDNRYIVFDDLNDSKLYRLTPPPEGEPASREIREIAVDGDLGDADGLEFVGRTLYEVDNGGERINKLRLSGDYLRARIESSTTSPDFHTPTTISFAPGNRLLVSNAEFFDQSEPGPPYFVVSIPRP